MAYELENIVREWMDHLKGLNVEVKKMFGCYCLYCDGQAVGWIHNSVMSLREVGLDYLPKDIKRPTKEDKIQELVIPLDYANADWLPKAVQDTAAIRKMNTRRPLAAPPSRKSETVSCFSFAQNEVANHHPIQSPTGRRKPLCSVPTMI